MTIGGGERTATMPDRSICIGTATRNRPGMLQRLLASYAAMRVPEGVRLHFVIVENNDTPSLGKIVGDFRASLPQWCVQYELEPCLGIASARNRVLECALRGGHELLTFVDDDELVEPEWLVELLAERDALDLDIVGSPVRLAPPQVGCSTWQKLIWATIDRKINESEARFLRLRELDSADQIPIATGSWMGNLAFFRRTGLRFDNRLGLGGDEDGRLWRAAKERGARTGWTPYAIAYEIVPGERLTLIYQYKRSRDYSITKYEERLTLHKRTALRKVPGLIAGKTLSLCVCLAAVPFTRGRSLVTAAWRVGLIAGVVNACLGRTSSHYQRTSGW